jgi:2,4-dienoyl-CoA reductase-like NADH-dependent reductase (Old Yellow Enzyme family)
MEKLFEPTRVGTKTAKNRLVFAATGTGYAHHNGSVSDQMLCHYSARAKGGAGWITIEHGFVDYRYWKQGRIPAYDQESFTVGLHDLAEVIHSFKALAVVQLSLGVGRQSTAMRAGTELVSASPVPYRVGQGSAPRGLKHFEGVIGEIPRELSTTEVKELEKGFVAAAERIARVGFDGIEIHGAHGYLLSSFLSPLTNRRGDEYGGSLEGRLRLSVHLIQKTRQALGKDFLLGYRISGAEHSPGGLSLEDTVEIAKVFSEAGLDFIHLSSGSIESMKYMIPEEEGVILPEAEGIKKAVAIPVICPNIHDPEKARQALDSGKADFISLSRPLLADPEWPNKVREGRANEIRRCLRCNRCLAGLWKGFGIRCQVNPQVGWERFNSDFWLRFGTRNNEGGKGKMSRVGLIANPASGKDIRRLVSHATVVSNTEKTDIVKRVILGLHSTGVDEILIMPEY